MAVTLDTKRNLIGIGRQRREFNYDITEMTLDPINSLASKNDVFAALAEPQISNVFTALRAIFIEEKIIAQLIAMGKLSAEATQTLFGLNKLQRSSHENRFSQKDLFANPKLFADKNFPALNTDGEAWVKNLSNFMKVLAPMKKQVMRWDASYFVNHASTLKRLLAFSQDLLLQPMDVKMSLMLTLDRSTWRDQEKTNAIVEYVNSDESKVNPPSAFTEYESKVLPYFLNLLSQTVVRVSLPGDAIRSGGDSFNNLCVFMSMPKLSVTNIPLSGGPRPRGPGG